MYSLFLERMGKLYKPEKIKGQSIHQFNNTPIFLSRYLSDGRFGAMMNVSLTNEVGDTGRFFKYDELTFLTLGSRHPNPRLAEV